MVLKPYNLIDILGELTLACGQVVGEPTIVVEEPATIAEAPALLVEFPTGAVEKSIEKLFIEAYTKDPILDDVL